MLQMPQSAVHDCSALNRNALHQSSAFDAQLNPLIALLELNGAPRVNRGKQGQASSSLLYYTD